MAHLKKRFAWVSKYQVKFRILVSLFQVLSTLGIVFDFPR